jgi:Na+/H+ antiporter NhaD/arsenite permease-like protein
MLLAGIIFIVAYILIISEKIPTAIIAMLGGFLMVALHVLNQEQAIHFIDFNTIGLLCGMMMVVSVMRKTGLFEYIAIKAIKIVGQKPWNVLVILSLLTAIMSALLDNVTTVLIIAPITLAITDSLRISPMPFLISEILFANIGGTATLIGDPPNILIGNSANLHFMSFVYHNLPVVIVCSIFVFVALKYIYKKELEPSSESPNILAHFDESRAIADKKLLIKSLIVFALVLFGFVTHNIFHIDLATIALGGGFLMLLITKSSVEEILKEVEWTTLFFFIGLFILVGGLEETGVIENVAIKLVKLTGTTQPMTFMVLWTSAIASTVVDNIPFTATMISVIKSIGKMTSVNIQPLWWALSLGACFGGNGTLVGAAANIIIASYASKNKTPIRFLDYLKIGFPLMICTIAIASLYIYFVHFFF